MNTNETSLQVIDNKGVLTKIINLFRKIFSKNKTTYIVSNLNENNRNENEFLKSIKFKVDPDKAKLLKIQDELEKRGINEKNAIELTKNLSEEQKQKLEVLYKQQIEELELSIQNYKNKIIAIRKKLA